MKTPIHYMLLMSLSILALIGCTEDDQAPSTLYNASNSEINEPVTWRSTDSILVDCVLLVNSTVTIEPGCTVTFTGNGYLKVGQIKNGAIIANGTAQKPIRFTHKPNNLTTVIQSGTWYGIYFGERNMVNTTILRHCIFEGAGKNNTPCIELYKTTLNLESSTIRSCANIGIKVTGESSGLSSFQDNTLGTCGSYLLTGTVESLSYLDSNNTLTPTGNKGIALLGGNIDTDCMLTKQTVPYTVLGNLYVDDAQLTLESGCTLAFSNSTSLNIGQEKPASLIAVGTNTDPILFTSAFSTPHPGDWQGLVFHSFNISSLTHLKYAIIEYAGQPVDSKEGAINTYSPIKVENSIIRKSSTCGLFCNLGVSISNFMGNSIETCYKYPLSIDINQAHTIDSTNVFSNNAQTYNFINLRGATLTSEVRWRKQGLPYLIGESLTISNPEGTAKLTLAKGCTVAVTSNIIVGENGCLSAIGTEQDSITFTSSAETPAPGDWSSIDFEKKCSPDNVLSYCKIEYGGYFSDYMVGVHTSKLAITNCSIRNSLKHGIFLYLVLPPITPFLNNNSFSNNGGDDIYHDTQLTF